MITENNFDAVIVGSGAGGAAAAYRLARAGWRVLMLEKGGRLPGDGSTLDVERVVKRGEFLSRETWHDGRGRKLVPEEHFNLGGKTKWYGAALLRFAPNEFAADEAHGCKAWPIAYADLAPYYAEIESLLGVKEYASEPALTRIVKRLLRPGSAWRIAALPLALSAGIVANRHEATHFDGFATVAGLKGDAENRLLARIASLPAVRIETNAEVVELLPAHDQVTRIGGVKLADGRCIQCRHVVLAAGALHSPRLLERYLRRQELAATLPCAAAVGRHLKLHLLTALVAVSPGDKRDLLRKTRFLTHEHYRHSSVQPLGFDADLIASLMPALLPQPVARFISSRAYGFFLQTEDGSAPANRVVDGDGAVPLLDYDASRTPAAAQEHRRFVQAFQRSLLNAGLLSFTQRIGLGGTAHACGTLATGIDPATSVVDGDGRVHGMQGLIIADGSVLPRSSRVNPSLTIYAWGLRVADLLVKRNLQASAQPAPQTAEVST